MQLYKSRDFSEFFQDTFGFIKNYGKHYFKHYFVINGVFLLILAVMMYFFTTFYTDILFNGLGSTPGYDLDNYMNENLGLTITFLLVFIIIALISGTISYSYTPIYLKLYNNNGDKNFGTKEIVSVYKKNAGKLLIYIICSIILAIPLLILFMIGAFVLAITIIGILAIPLLIGAFVLFYTMALMEYLENKKGIWDSFGYSWSLLSSKFWAAVGCVGIFYLISYVLQYFVQLISSLFTMGNMFFNIEQNAYEPDEIGTTMTVFMLVIFFLSFAVNIVVQNVIQLNQGIVFYSLKEEKENIHTKDIIDLIGSGE